MTVTELIAIIRKRVEDAASVGLPASDDVYWTSGEGYAALNEAQEQFALLTICLESSGTVPLAAGTCFYSIRDYLTGYLVPLRVEVSGRRLEPSRLVDLDTRYFTWQSRSGTPERYAHRGLTLLAIVPQPAAPVSATVIYAREPQKLTAGGDTPEIPAEHHWALARYAVYYLLQKMGGQYLRLALEEWNEFLGAAAGCADRVRERNRARRYDTLPLPLRRPVRKEGMKADA